MSKLYTFHNLHSTAGTFRAEIRFDASHPVFAGHFPGQPVVPGVFLIEILAAAISEIAGRPYIVKEALNLKFLQVIDPMAHPTVVLEGTNNEDDAENFKVDATFRHAELLFAKFKGVMLAGTKDKN